MTAPHDLTYIERTVLAMVTEAAENGAPCPTNTEIGDALGIAANGGGSEVLRRLERMELVYVHRRGNRRDVTILATGKRTSGLPKNLTREARSASAKAVPRISPSYVRNIDAGNLPRVDRDACFYCGARGDLCCCKVGRRI